GQQDQPLACNAQGFYRGTVGRVEPLQQTELCLAEVVCHLGVIHPVAVRYPDTVFPPHDGYGRHGRVVRQFLPSLPGARQRHRLPLPARNGTYIDLELLRVERVHFTAMQQVEWFARAVLGLPHFEEHTLPRERRTKRVYMQHGGSAVVRNLHWGLRAAAQQFPRRTDTRPRYRVVVRGGP